MARENMMIQCAHCGAKNRVPRSRMTEKAVCGKCRQPLSRSNQFPDGPLDVGDHRFREEVLGFPGGVVVEFWTPRCGYCRSFEPTFRELAQEYYGRVKFVKVNIDSNAVTPSQYAIKGTPTLLFFKGGRQVNRVDGAVPKAQVERLLPGIL
jgi:thioredoxin 2